jgi:hypothetical protein
MNVMGDDVTLRGLSEQPAAEFSVPTRSNDLFPGVTFKTFAMPTRLLKDAVKRCTSTVRSTLNLLQDSHNYVKTDWRDRH